MILSVICGCGLTTTNANKYRSQIAMVVNGEEITLGTILDAYTNYYQNYYYYVANGTYTTEQVFELAIQAMVDVHLRATGWKAIVGTNTHNHDYVGDYKNAEYLTASEVDYLVKYAYSQIFASVDSYTQTEVAKFYDFGTIQDSKDNREFTEYDVVDTTVANAYTNYLYLDTLDDEDLDERAKDLTALPENFDELVFSTATDAELLEKVQKFNDAIIEEIKAGDDYVEGDEDDAELLTAEEYIVFQQRGVKNYKNALKESYGYDFEDIVKAQIESAIISQLALKYNYHYYAQVEENLTTLLATLTSNWETSRVAAEATYALSPDAFVNFAESITNTSFIYSVPTEYANSFVQTKNLLISFSDKQTDALAQIATRLGSRTSEEYIEQRARLAAATIAEDFNNEVDFDDYDSETKLANTFFQYNETTGELELIATSSLGQALLAGATQEEFVELMEQYNTDIGQHSNIYSYVSRLDATPSGYSPKFVDEYVEGAKQAYNSALNFSIAVSDYGIHIIYSEGLLTAQAGNFTADSIYDLSTAESRYFQNYYNSMRTIKLGNGYDTLLDSIIDSLDSKIQINSALKELINNSNYDVDLEELLTGLKSK